MGRGVDCSGNLFDSQSYILHREILGTDCGYFLKYRERIQEFQEIQLNYRLLLRYRVFIVYKKIKYPFLCMTLKAALYARVSTENQDLNPQKKKLEDWAESEGYDYEIYSETISGKNDEREQFQKLMDKVRLGEFDIVAVTKIDRFGRSTRHILQNIDEVEEYSASFVTIDQPIDTREDSMMGEMMKQLLSVFADFERRMIRQRMEEGFRKAQEEGRVGRPKKLSKEQIEDGQNKYDRGWSKKQVHSYLKGKYDVDVSYETLRKAIGGNIDSGDLQ